jgi:hypothetical protein
MTRQEILDLIQSAEDIEAEVRLRKQRQLEQGVLYPRDEYQSEPPPRCEFCEG